LRLFDENGAGEPEPRVDPRLVVALLRHEYTHHLRELERLLWLAVTTTREPFVALTREVEAEIHLPAPAVAGEPSADQIRAALAATSGNVSHAAKKLGLASRYQLYRLMKRHGVSSPSEEDDGQP
jgi:two-component system nitrogen regulation response regulator GlnG/two-component system response regulator HydG